MYSSPSFIMGVAFKKYPKIGGSCEEYVLCAVVHHLS